MVPKRVESELKWFIFIDVHFCQWFHVLKSLIYISKQYYHELEIFYTHMRSQKNLSEFNIHSREAFFYRRFFPFSYGFFEVFLFITLSTTLPITIGAINTSARLINLFIKFVLPIPVYCYNTQFWKLRNIKRLSYLKKVSNLSLGKCTPT